jgi:hypothetical protein
LLTLIATPVVYSLLDDLSATVPATPIAPTALSNHSFLFGNLREDLLESIGTSFPPPDCARI